MAAAPLPPHERPWRHPSELGPTAATVEPSSLRSRMIAVSSGAVAAVLVAVMIVSVSPKRSTAPNAISATTRPPAAATEARPQAAVAAATLSDDTVRIGASSLSGTSARPGAALVGAPNAISAAPIADPAALDVSPITPDPEERVLVLTASFTYDVPWHAIDDLWAPSGSVVVTHDGALLALFDDVGLRLLVD